MNLFLNSFRIIVENNIPFGDERLFRIEKDDGRNI